MTMNRAELEAYILETYHAEADTPWIKYPDNKVFRHSNNRKWFALLMRVPKSSLGLRGDGALDVVNLKCDPVLIGSFLMEPGFFPAYHMSKEHWITAALDGSVPDEKVKTLLDLSYSATAPRKKAPGQAPKASFREGEPENPVR